MGEALENPGNPALNEGAKQNLSCLKATFSQSVREEIQNLQQPELGPAIWPLILVLSWII